MGDRAYTPVRITTIKAERVVPFSLFIYFKEQYLEYVTPGNAISPDKYKKLRKQKITKFFIKGADENKYQDFLDNFIMDTLNSDQATVDEKTEIVSGHAETAIDKLIDDPADEASFDMTRKASQNIQKLIFENPESLKSLFGKDTTEAGPIFTHSMNVCALGIKFAKKKKLSEEEIDYLSTASLMHDIGIMHLPEETQKLFETPKSELSPPDKVKYYEHCKGVVKILAERPYINGKIIDLIENHEENLQGSGPMKQKKLSLSAEILSMVNCYDKKIMAKKISPAEAIKEMMIDELGNYTLALLKEFQGFLKEEQLI